MLQLLNFFTAILVLLALMISGCASTGPSPAEPYTEGAEAAPPKVAEFILGVGDSIDISVYRNDDLKLSTKINPSGTVIFPLIGEVPVAGKSMTALREDLRQRYAKYIVDPQITISVSAIQSQRFLVLGEIKNPGAFSLDTDATVLDAVAKAGGWTQDAKTSNVLLLRNVGGKLETRSLDMEAVLKGGNLAYNQRLQRNDIVYVPTKKIADIARFAQYLSSILSPVIMVEGGIVLAPQAIDVIAGKKPSTQLTIPTQ